jgi:hypothetical protein
MKRKFQQGDKVLTPEGPGYIDGPQSVIGEWPVVLPSGQRWYFDEDFNLSGGGL